MFSSAKELPCSCRFSDDHAYIGYSSPPMALSSFPTQNPLAFRRFGGSFICLGWLGSCQVHRAQTALINAMAFHSPAGSCRHPTPLWLTNGFPKVVCTRTWKP
ncbi:hypothetical protein CSKR_107421 [Clonorchis sinensis]|uniref:Uncharacterized protein n=1 Tax=Clonorchis sinensis TaxID=79923 RepID=A0A3R7GIQ9_CLOSI|nr:hypothetical protein CSKR_107421 [Clonorchis sinensis]